MPKYTIEDVLAHVEKVLRGAKAQKVTGQWTLSVAFNNGGIRHSVVTPELRLDAPPEWWDALQGKLDIDKDAE